MHKRAIAVAAIATLASTSVIAADMPGEIAAAGDRFWSWSGFPCRRGRQFQLDPNSGKRFRAYPASKILNNWARFLGRTSAGGRPFFDFNRNKSGFAPDLQLGYMVPFAGGGWQAGLKFNYKYANIDSKENVSILRRGPSHGGRAADH